MKNEANNSERTIEEVIKEYDELATCHVSVRYLTHGLVLNPSLPD